MPTTLDLVQNTVEKKPSEFSTNFSDLVQDRIRELIVKKRQEVAANLFGAQKQEEPEKDVEQVAQAENEPETGPVSEPEGEDQEQEEPVDADEPEGEPDDQETA